MAVRGLVAGLIFGLGASSYAMASEDDTLRDYDRESLNSLFEQAQSGDVLPGMSDDDFLITGSIGSGTKKSPPPAEEESRVPVSRPSR